MYEEARSRAVVEVGGLGMVPMYIAYKKATLLLERGGGWPVYEAVVPSLQALGQRAMRGLGNRVAKSEFAVVPTIPRTFSRIGSLFAIRAAEALLQLGQIQKVTWQRCRGPFVGVCVWLMALTGTFFVFVPVHGESSTARPRCAQRCSDFSGVPLAWICRGRFSCVWYDFIPFTSRHNDASLTCVVFPDRAAEGTRDAKHGRDVQSIHGERLMAYSTLEVHGEAIAG